MRLILFTLLILIYLPSFGQIKNLPNLSHYENFNGIIMDYSAYNELELTEKYFGFNLKGIISEKAYNYFDLTRLGSKEGEINVSDTLYYSDKLTQIDINEIIANYLSHFLNINIKPSSNGIYFLNVLNKFSYFSDIKLEYFIKIEKSFLTINLNQKLNFRLNSSDIFAVENILMPYNSRKLPFQLLIKTNAENTRNFNNHLAFQQAVMYSSILETRNLIKEQFYNYLNLYKSSKLFY
jgi:hypothetical protein